MGDHSVGLSNGFSFPFFFWFNLLGIRNPMDYDALNTHFPSKISTPNQTHQSISTKPTIFLWAIRIH